MPIYDYKCSECAAIFEICKGMNEEIKDLECPKCNGFKVNRNFSSVQMGKFQSSSTCSTCTDGVCGSCGRQG